MKKKNKKKLPGYWLGTRKPTSLGYQPNYGIGNALFTSVEGEDLTPEAEAARRNIIPSALGKISQQGMFAANLLQHGSSVAGAALSQGARAALHRAGLSVAQIAPDVTVSATPGAFKAAEAVGGEAAKQAGKTVLSGAGKALGALGAAYSAYSMFNDFANAGDIRSAGDMRNTASTNTYTTAGGNQYTQYGGIDASAERKYENTMKTQRRINLGLDAAGLTTGILGAATTINPLLGLVSFPIVYGLSSLLGFGDNSDELEQQMINTTNTLAMENRQNRSAAESDDVKQAFYGRAANGKQPVWSPEGLVNRKATARVSNGELIGNFEDGYVSRVPGKKNNKDTKLANLKDSDFVISNKYGLSDYAAATGDYEGALNMLNMLMSYKNGKKPCCKNGKLPKLFMGIPPITDVDTRSDTTRRGIHEGSIPYGAGNSQAGLFPLFSIADQIDRLTNMLRPDSPVYHPGLITGAPDILPGKVPSKVTYTPLQMLKMWLQHGQQYAKNNNLSTFMGPNGKMYAKTADGKVRSFESIGKEIYGETPTTYTPKVFKPIKQLSAKTNTVSAFNKPGRGKIYNSNTLSANDEFENGKLPKHALGTLGEYALATLPHMAGFFSNLGLYNRAKHADTYVPQFEIQNPESAAAINQVMSDMIDPREYLNQSNKTYRQSLWNTQRMAGMGMGGRAIMADALTRAKLAQDAETRMKIDEANRGQRNLGAQMRDRMGQDLLSKRYDNMWRRHAAAQQANAAKENWLAQYRKNMDTAIGDLGADALRMIQYNQARDQQNKMLGIYQQQVNIDKLKALSDISRFNNSTGQLNPLAFIQYSPYGLSGLSAYLEKYGRQ